MALKTDYKDEVLSSSKPYRMYNIVDGGGSTLYSGVRINRADAPQQEGSKFGASDINSTNEQVNQNTVDINECMKQFTYSTEEQWTGQKWIDGSKIYHKTVSFPVATTGFGNRSHSIANIENVVDYKVVAYVAGGDKFYVSPVNYYDSATSGVFYSTQFWVTKTHIEWANNTSWPGYRFYATIYYTKTTD